MNTPTTFTAAGDLEVRLAPAIIEAGALRWSGGWPRSIPTVSMREIATDIAAECGLQVSDFRGLSIPRAVRRIRQEAMAAMHAEGFSHTQIVRFFRLKNHTTSIWACRAVAKRRALTQQGAV